MQRTPRLTFKRLTGPDTEPVSLDEAKAHARVDIEDDDALFDAWITRAREHCEAITQRQFITATYAMLMDGFPMGYRSDVFRATDRREGYDILLPRPPLVSVETIVYKDTAGISRTIDAAVYIVSDFDEPGRVALANGATWPQALDEINAVRIDYTAGYGAAEDVPESIKQAMLLLIAHWNENREATQSFATLPKEMDFAVKETLRPFTIGELWQGSLQ